ncbi:MAG TPA: topoisomerase C-terminal repeat-containing protein, partial [Chryseolinea sp.]
FEEKPVVVSIGRFGPYVLHDKKFVSIPKDHDPYTIAFEKAVELIQAKRIADANRLIKAFPENPDIQILNGRFGPYIKAGKKNVKIPKDREPASLTLEECVTLAANAPEKRGRFGRKSQAAPEVPKTAAEPAKKKAAALETAVAKKAAPAKKAVPAKKAKASVAKKKAAPKATKAPKKKK